MKTKNVWVMASLAVLCVVSHADEKNKEAAAKPAATSEHSPFLVPIPKDSSEFTVKPPPVGTIHNPALDAPIRDTTKLDRLLYDRTSRIVPEFPSSNTKDSTKTYYFRSWDFALKSAERWRLISVPLSAVLFQLKRSYNVKILTSSSPEQPFEDAKISMTLKGKTVEEKLGSLSVIGLSWSKTGDVYYVSWDKQDLPSSQKAITPAPQ